MLLALPRFTSSPDGPDSPTATAAIEVVERLAVALATDDTTAALALFSDDWVAVSLPGVVTSVRSSTGGDLPGLIDFYAEVSDVTITGCETRHRRVAVGEIVVCATVTDNGAYRAATVYPFAWWPQLTFRVVDGEIVTLVDNTAENGEGRSPGLRSYVDYCIWAEATHPQTARLAFTLDCQPIEDQSTAPAHNELSASFVAAGSPAATAGGRALRRRAGIVGDMIALHNEGRPTPAARMMEPGWSAVTTLVGIDPSADGVPAAHDYLAWSAALFDIDLGRCVTTIGSRTLATIDCPEAELAGPLPEALGPGRMQAPMQFEVQQLITSWRARPAPEMRVALGRLCIAAGSPGCGGVMTAEGASLLFDIVGAAGS